jgi:hypothetical protein
MSKARQEEGKGCRATELYSRDIRHRVLTIINQGGAAERAGCCCYAHHRTLIIINQSARRRLRTSSRRGIDRAVLRIYITVYYHQIW